MTQANTIMLTNMYNIGRDKRVLSSFLFFFTTRLEKNELCLHPVVTLHSFNSIK